MNFDRFLHIISKWPVDPNRRGLDYGYFLRELVKNKDLSGNVFPGTVEENTKKLNALLRLLNNTYKNKYSFPKKKGASGLEIESLNALLSNKKYVVVQEDPIFKLEIKEKKGKEPKSDKTSKHQ